MTMPNIAARVFNTPLLVEPRKGVAFLQGLGPRLTGGDVQVDIGNLTIAEGEPEATAQPLASLLGDELAFELKHSNRKGYSVINGVAVISVGGVLIHRGAWVGKSSGQTSYEGIAAQIEAAIEDQSVKGIALEIDSFGGEVAGLFDFCDRIRAARDQKTIWAFVAEHSYSAAYAIASQANRIILPRTGGVGSIGVVIAHVDYSQALEESGQKITLIHSGAHKVDGNSFQPLSKDVLAGFQAEIDATRELFAETVSKGRGKAMSAKKALATEAKSFTGQEAVDLGLADVVQDIKGAFAAFQQHLSPGSRTVLRQSAKAAKTRGGPKMGNKKTAKTAVKTEKSQVSDDQIDAENDDEAGVSDDAEQGAKSDENSSAASEERKRVAAILNAPEAANREELAKHFAFDTDLTPKDAIAAMKAAPKGNAQGGKLGLGDAMGGSSTLQPGGGSESTAETVASRMKERLDKK